MSEAIKICGLCKRVTIKGKNIAWLTGLNKCMCCACLSVWYDGQTDPETIVFWSMQYDPDSYAACAGSEKPPGFNPEVLPLI